MNATEEDLAHLAEECDPATFGLNHEDVLDETYRKAGKLDAIHFSAAFDLSESDLPQVVSGALLEGHPANSAIRFEKYKINVYGQFWVAHVAGV